LDETEKNIDYISKIVQDLQEYARPLNPKIEKIDLKMLVENLIIKNGIPQNIKTKVEVSDNAKKIRADPYYLNRILYNLIINAVQAMPNGDKITVSSKKRKMIQFCVLLIQILAFLKIFKTKCSL
jgi:signal transduction histidine kinase